MSRTHESFRTPRTHEARHLRPFAFSNTQHSNTLRITLLHTAARLFEILCVDEHAIFGDADAFQRSQCRQAATSRRHAFTYMCVHIHICVCETVLVCARMLVICIYACVCVCVCVCVCALDVAGRLLCAVMYLYVCIRIHMCVRERECLCVCV